MPESQRQAEDALTKAQALLDFNARVDELVEESLQSRRSMTDTMAHVLPALCEALGARCAFLRSYSEDLSLTTVVHPPGTAVPALEEALERTGPEGDAQVLHASGAMLVVQPLDVAGEWFGNAGVVLDEGSEGAKDLEHAAHALDVFCEEVDNFLYSIRAARERHRVMMALNDALRHQVLSEGLRAAVRVLCDAVPVERLLLTCVAEEAAESAVHVQVFEGPELRYDTMGALPPAPDEHEVRELAATHLRKGDAGLLRRFDFHNAQEEVLINGVTATTVVGKVLVTSRVGGFNTYDRELLAGFAGFIRQRVVDFNKEWRTLARSFRAEDVGRLLNDPNYVRKYLSPREAEVAIIFVDISGFTRISEQILKSPSAVAHFVEEWSRDAVELVWAHGGVFDKMVGDCVIALFGPPFFDTTPEDRVLRALRCAHAIRAMTRALPARPGLEPLRAEGLAVSTGVHFAPLFVGRFGPNDNFTGFSSGMNNTARLQGCAHRDELLVMAEAAARLPEGHGFRFGPAREARVKNVAEPLRFLPVED